MRVLFISTNGIKDVENGGAKCSIRNYNALCQFGDVDVYTIQKKSNLQSAVSILNGLYPPISREDINSLEIMSKNDYNIIFFDGSIFGSLISQFSEQKKIVFYHNCEHDYINVRFGKTGSIKKWIYQKLVDKAERTITKTADWRICLSQRDASRINQLYGKQVEMICPIGMEDKYEVLNSEDVEPYCLLFGAMGTANKEGYEWFVRNVSPHLNCKTVVAGKGFEAFKEEWQSDKVDVKGFVESIQRIYTDASCVAIPLLSGGGMKIKTVEALMFGKRIFGTDEAMSGFEFNYDGIVDVCNETRMFIDGINKYIEEDNRKFITEAREIYLKNYSVESAYESFGKMIRSLTVK